VNNIQTTLDRDKVDFVVGPIISNVLLTLGKPVTDQISPYPLSCQKGRQFVFFATAAENSGARIGAAAARSLEDEP
jgi:hypothetical protein